MKIKHLLVSLFVAVFMLAGPVWAGEKVNLNSSTVTELQAVKGIGEAKLAKIKGAVETDDHDTGDKASH
ncbi:hypothetical protein [Mariprofundus sp. KV]|uniref:hypothetical protein n=1 Tax=Mariprofundus sp. KV TaxID=2608715 RepID=UPI0015A352F7|nr:hypothetical protein [Mariprofundus sp. KV]NWF36786.1 hypothetical protein [Mariprofundus sp. KV]